MWHGNFNPANLSSEGNSIRQRRKGLSEIEGAWPKGVGGGKEGKEREASGGSGGVVLPSGAPSR